jgi:hypothetical protein
VLFWLVDNALLWYLLLGCVLLAVAAYWWMRRKRQFLIAAGIVTALILLVWLLTRVVVTDRQQIRRNIEEMAQAVADNKPDVIAKHLSRDFDYYGLKTDAVVHHIAAASRAYGVSYVRVWDFDFEYLSHAEGRARIAFRARADLGPDITMWLCRAEFILEDGQWRMQHFDVYNPVVNTDQPIQIPLR